MVLALLVSSIFVLAFSQTLTLNKNSFAYNENILATFSRTGATTTDWVGIYASTDGTPDGSPGSTIWQYTCGGQTTCSPAVGSGSLIFGQADPTETGTVTWPLPTGSYNAWYLANDGYTVLSGPFAFSVTGGPALQSHVQPADNLLPREIAIFSCYDNADDATQLWNDVAAQGVDLGLWLGDNIYADTTSMTTMRSKYDAKKQNVGYSAFMSRNIPIMATWDDHDMGVNNAGKYYSARTGSQAEFVRHFDFPLTDPRNANGGGTQLGIYSSKLFGTQANSDRVHIILMDARYHRSPTFSAAGTCEGAASSFLGASQWTWLENQMRTVTSEIKIIGSGIQHLNPTWTRSSMTSYCAYDGSSGTFVAANAEMGEPVSTTNSNSYEMWAEIPQERRRLLRLAQESISTGKTKLVLFVSGDQHWGELHRKVIPAVGQHNATSVYEITASGINQNWSPAERNANRYPVWADTTGAGAYNKQCVFPFKKSSGNIQYKACITGADAVGPLSNTPLWCALSLTTQGRVASWGRCVPEGVATPDGTAGTYQLQGDTPHYINSAVGNYGLIKFDPVAKSVRVEIRTPYAANKIGAYTTLKYT